MGISERISFLPLAGIKPPRWRVLFETGLYAASGNMIEKHVGDLIEETPTCFKCIFLIKSTQVTTEKHKNHKEAVKAFCEWVEALGVYQPSR